MLANALIPARGGSKGIVGKNARPFCGKPLLSWAVEVGLEVCNDTYVSTDDEHLADLARESGALVIQRPGILAMDWTPMLEVVQHASSMMDRAADVIVLLQPTQPLREAKHVLQACRMLDDTGADSVVSVVQVPGHYAPEYVMRLEEGRLHPFVNRRHPPTRRQDCLPAYSRDGTVYAIRRSVIDGGSLYGDHCRALVVPSSESANIDTEQDWRWAEYQRNSRDA